MSACDVQFVRKYDPGKKKKFSLIFLIWIFFFKIWSWKSKLRSPFWVKKNVTVILKTWKWHLLSGPDTLSVDVTILDTYFIFLQVILFEIDEKYFQYKPKCVGWMLWIDCWCSIWNCFYRFDYLQNVYIKWQTNCHILVYLKKLCFKFIKNSLTSLSTYHTYIDYVIRVHRPKYV